MSSVKENIIKIKVLAALIGVNILKNNWRSMNWRIIVSNGWVSEEEYYTDILQLQLHGHSLEFMSENG